MKKNTYVNLTNHTITELTSGKVIPRSGIVFRVNTSKTLVSTCEDGIQFFKMDSEIISELPPKKDDTIYIISALALNSIPNNRQDIVAPGNVQKDEHGQVTGCWGFRLKGDTNAE